MGSALDLIFKRRSIRQYTAQPVEKEVLVQLLRAAMAAPSAVNSQPWEFVVITSPDGIQKLGRILPLGRYNAPAAIVVCGSPLRARNPAGLLFWVQDCSAAIQNILLAATGMGLGSVWIGVHPVAALARQVRKILHIPPHVTPLGVVYVGYAAEEKEARTRYREDRVHWDVYDLFGRHRGE
jgi:nitroreductase